jgi:voltage-gated potassium channel
VKTSRLRGALARALDPDLRPEPGLSPVNRAIIWLILLSLVLVVIETEPVVYERHHALFEGLELLLLAVFTVEYAARIWVSTENPRFSSRLDYARRPIALLDLFVIVTMAVSLVGFEGAILRLLRLARLLRVAKLGRFAEAFRTIWQAVGARRYELGVSLAIAVALLIVSASALYLLEGGLQPDAFGSIPRAMWWSVATLTTVGYGDVVPLTPLGRVFATLTAITGVGLIAMPAGILASAFSDALQREREKKNREGGDGV